MIMYPKGIGLEPTTIILEIIILTQIKLPFFKKCST